MMSDLVTKENQEAAVNAIKRLIAIPSYNTPKEPHAAFGLGIRHALEEAAKICEEVGGKSFVDPEGHYAYADFGSGDTTFGVVGHVDTVPAGDLKTWHTNPFTPVVKDGVIYGRGVQDDKGPMMTSLFALKSVLDAGYHLNRKVRFIFGSDEEILWRGIAEYNKHEDPVDLGISPDAEFPVTYKELALQDAHLVGPGSDQLHVKTGGAFNAVPDKAVYDGPQQDQVKKALDKFGFKYQADDKRITVLGKAAHAIHGDQGINAVLHLGMALNQVFDLPQLRFFDQFNDDWTGTSLLGQKVADESGHLMFNVSSIEITPDKTEMQINLRIPTSYTRDQIIEMLNNAVKPFNLSFKHYDYLAPLSVPKDSELVQTLMDVYREKTGDTKAEPLINPGATFARTMGHSVAFGAMFPDTPDYMHQANEQWPLSHMYRAMDIYAEAFKRLVTNDQK